MPFLSLCLVSITIAIVPPSIYQLSLIILFTQLEAKHSRVSVSFDINLIGHLHFLILQLSLFVVSRLLCPCLFNYTPSIVPHGVCTDALRLQDLFIAFPFPFLAHILLPYFHYHIKNLRLLYPCSFAHGARLTLTFTFTSSLPSLPPPSPLSLAFPFSISIALYYKFAYHTLTSRSGFRDYFICFRRSLFLNTKAERAPSLARHREVSCLRLHYLST